MKGGDEEQSVIVSSPLASFGPFISFLTSPSSQFLDCLPCDKKTHSNANTPNYSTTGGLEGPKSCSQGRIYISIGSKATDSPYLITYLKYLYVVSSLLSNIFISIYLEGRVIEERGREISSAGSFLECPPTARAGSWQIWEPEIPAGCPTWVAGTEALEPSSATSQDALIGSCMESEITRTQIGTPTWDVVSPEAGSLTVLQHVFLWSISMFTYLLELYSILRI